MVSLAIFFAFVAIIMFLIGIVFYDKGWGFLSVLMVALAFLGYISRNVGVEGEFYCSWFIVMCIAFHLGVALSVYEEKFTK